MRAAVTPEPGGVIEATEVEDPERMTGDVLVRVHAASVNRLDRAVYDGVGLGAAATFPLIQGIDAAGIIESGSGALATGLRVVVKPTIACRRCRSCGRGREADCERARTLGIHRQGGWAELVSVPHTNLAIVPQGLSFTEAAAAAHSHAVALRMIRATGDLQPEATMLVTGAGGALGTACVQLGVAMGARVIAVASTRAKLEEADALGAALLADHTEVDDLPGAILDANSGVGVDLVLETTGTARMISDGYAMLARGGTLVLVAGTSGTVLELDVNELYRERKTVIGSAGSNDRDFADTFRFLADHDIHPVISATFPLSEAQNALDAVLDRKRIGKIVIDVGDTG